MHSRTYTNAVLTAIAILLTVLALRPGLIVNAQPGTPSSIYVEPGVVNIRTPDGSAVGPGRMMIDLRTGDTWGYLTYSAPYPNDTTSSKPATVAPVYLGRFDLSKMHK